MISGSANVVTPVPRLEIDCPIQNVVKSVPKRNESARVSGAVADASAGIQRTVGDSAPRPPPSLESGSVTGRLEYSAELCRQRVHGRRAEDAVVVARHVPEVHAAQR